MTLQRSTAQRRAAQHSTDAETGLLCITPAAHVRRCCNDLRQNNEMQHMPGNPAFASHRPLTLSLQQLLIQAAAIMMMQHGNERWNWWPIRQTCLLPTTPATGVIKGSCLRKVVTCNILFPWPASRQQSPPQTAVASGWPGQSWWKRRPRICPKDRSAPARTCSGRTKGNSAVQAGHLC